MNEARRTRLPIPSRRVMLVGAAVFIVLGVGLVRWYPNYQQLVAIREIERMGGTVWSRDGGPDWLRELVGDDWMKGFDHVDRLTYYGRRIKGEELSCIAAFTNLRKLRLSNVWLTDEETEQLAELTSLEALSLNNTHIGANGMRHLGGMTSIRRLILDGVPQVSQVGVAALQKKLPQCRIYWSRPR